MAGGLQPAGHDYGSGETQPVIRIRGLHNQFGAQVIHDGLDLDVRRGEVLGIVGGSGSGKSVLLRTIVGLNRPQAGHVEVLGRDMSTLSKAGLAAMQAQWGVLFQDGALFSSLTVLENVMTPMQEHRDWPTALERELAGLKIRMVGLPGNACSKYPSELSGGMRKRAGLARALALDPPLLFLDEPTAGLDPIGAAEFDQLIRSLQQSLGLTVFMVTHDLDSLAAICDRIAVLVDRTVLVDTMARLMDYDHPWIRDYFHGPRARSALRQDAAMEPAG
jgi:phospholipid/cholesterol/gamma-HCH transport system ATP-binding protein